MKLLIAMLEGRTKYGSLNAFLVALHFGIRPETNIKAAARELGVSRDTVRRARERVAKIDTSEQP